MLFYTKIDEYRSILSELSDQIGQAIISLIKASLHSSRQPYDFDACYEVNEATKVFGRIISDIIKATIENNRGKGSENAHNKEEFMFAIKGIKDILTQIHGLTLPNPTNEILSAADNLLKSCLNFVNIESKSIAQNAKIVKDSMRYLFGLINICSKAAKSEESFLKIQSEAVELNYKVKEFIQLTKKNSSPDSLNESHEKVKEKCQIIISLAKETFGESDTAGLRTIGSYFRNKRNEALEASKSEYSISSFQKEPEAKTPEASTVELLPEEVKTESQPSNSTADLITQPQTPEDPESQVLERPRSSSTNPWKRINLSEYQKTHMEPTNG